jgi:hypothetical protein
MKRNLLLVLISVGSCLIVIIIMAQFKQRTPIYYQQLDKLCQQNNNNPCCQNSVNTMEKNNFLLVENDICPPGYTLNMNRCMDSLKWCEPVE